MKRRKNRVTYFFETFNPFVDYGVRNLSRAEIVAYLVLLRDTKPDGTASTSYTDIATRGGMYEDVRNSCGPSTDQEGSRRGRQAREAAGSDQRHTAVSPAALRSSNLNGHLVT